MAPFATRLLIVFALLAAAPAHAADYVPGEILVKFKPGVERTAKPALSAKLRRAGRRFEGPGIEHWYLPPGVDTETALAQLRASKAVEFAEPNYRRHPRAVDPLRSEQWALNKMQLPDAWALTTGSANVVVAVVDDGVATNHPDLAANIVPGWDFMGNDADPSPASSDEHGTMVAGIIGAVGDNGIGMTGAAWQVSIMPLRFGFDVASELASYEYAVANGAHIVNASWGGPAFSLAEYNGVQTLEDAGILLIAAAGNWTSDNDLVPDYPSGLPNPNVISVAASDETDALSWFSHYGAANVDLAAPGNNVLLTVKPGSGSIGATHCPGSGCDYESAAGTSFSAPYVAGIAALVKALYPGASFREIKGRLLAGVDPLTDVKYLLAAGGRANAFKALDVSPQPVLVYAGHRISEPGNGLLEPGETADLVIDLENVWLDASGVQVTLVSDDAKFEILQSAPSLGALASGATSSVSFPVRLAAGAGGHLRVPLRLQITAGAYSVERGFLLELGTLQYGVAASATIQQNLRDLVHLWTLEIPPGKSRALIELKGTAGQDLDLVVRQGAKPEFDISCLGLDGCAGDGTLVSASAGSDEQIELKNPTAGTYYVAVISYATASNVPYTVLAKSRGGGGGGGEGFGLVMLSVLLLGVRLAVRAGRK